MGDDVVRFLTEARQNGRVLHLEFEFNALVLSGEGDLSVREFRSEDATSCIATIRVSGCALHLEAGISPVQVAPPSVSKLPMELRHWHQLQLPGRTDDEDRRLAAILRPGDLISFDGLPTSWVVGVELGGSANGVHATRLDHDERTHDNSPTTQVGGAVLTASCTALASSSLQRDTRGGAVRGALQIESADATVRPGDEACNSLHEVENQNPVEGTRGETDEKTSARPDKTYVQHEHERAGPGTPEGSSRTDSEVIEIPETPDAAGATPEGTSAGSPSRANMSRTRPRSCLVAVCPDVLSLHVKQGYREAETSESVSGADSGIDEIPTPRKPSKKRTRASSEMVESEQVENGPIVKRKKGNDEDGSEYDPDEALEDRPRPTRSRASVRSRKSGSTVTSKSSKSSKKQQSSESKKPAKTSVRVAFSNSDVVEDAPLKKFLRNQRVKIADDVTEKSCDMLCVGSGEFKKTAKLLMAVALGKKIVADTWIRESSKQGELLDSGDYIAANPEQEEAWGFRPADCINNGRPTLFQGQSVYISPHLEKELGEGYNSLTTVLQTCGAQNVKYLRGTKEGRDNIVLVQGPKDHALRLAKEGLRCYHKDLVSASILRGSLDLGSDEFRIHGSKVARPTKSR